MENILIVIDMQKDFINGTLGTKEEVHEMKVGWKILKKYSTFQRDLLH